MITVSGEKITIARGDVGTVVFAFTGAVSEGDTVKLLIGESPGSGAAITKTTTLSAAKKAAFAFTGEETDVEPFGYVYSLRLVRTGGYDTPIKNSSFVVEGVVENG